MGIEVSPEHFTTSAVATAIFLQTRRPGARIIVIGDHGLHQALTEAGFTITKDRLDDVILGETVCYSYERIEKNDLQSAGRGTVDQY